ncbi:MAG: DUF4833 domain-containing protein, partial [Chrysiogenales bacterium]
ERLFVIERNVISNIVVYDADVVPGRLFNRARPVDAYWIMREEGSRREELNYIEKQWAYGFDIESVQEGSRYRMAIRSFRERPITVVLEKDRPRAIIDINGRRSYLTRIYIATSGKSILPSVDHLVLYGVDMSSGEYLREKITER